MAQGRDAGSGVATADESARGWLAQWERAAIELARVHTDELQALSANDALAASELLLAMVKPSSLPMERQVSSGLVEQQRLFMRFFAK